MRNRSRKPVEEEPERSWTAVLIANTAVAGFYAAMYVVSPALVTYILLWFAPIFLSIVNAIVGYHMYSGRRQKIITTIAVAFLLLWGTCSAAIFLLPVFL
ncbi:MAG TPA: hypothetical protein DIS79_10205 [Bacteroidetes bacterium]|nr:hypothetical protein [Bacteroidota bacterium]HRK04831.1 hypothetical protein [Chlorobiota bacterium]